MLLLVVTLAVRRLPCTDCAMTRQKEGVQQNIVDQKKRADPDRRHSGCTTQSHRQTIIYF